MSSGETKATAEPTAMEYEGRSRYKYRNDVEAHHQPHNEGGDEDEQGAQLPFAVIEILTALKDRRNVWKHLLLLYIVAFVTFIMAAVAVGRTSGSSSSYQSTASTSVSFCQGKSDLLWGDQVQSYNGRNYQLVDRRGSNGVNWKEALSDAASRCYHGTQGRLASIESAEENNFVHLLLFSAVYTDDENHSLNSEPAWVGGTDMLASTGEFSWVTKYGGITSDISSEQFWTDGEGGSTVHGAYTNWKAHEPSTSSDDDTTAAASGSFCVEMDTESGFWRVDSCLEAKYFFVVEFS